MVTIDNGDDGVSGNSILDALEEARIFSVNKTDDGRFEFQESCDNWFFAKLTKEQVLALSEELNMLATGDA